MSTITLTPREAGLREALRAARDAAHEAALADSTDGGSANLDAAFLHARRGLTSRIVENAARACGVDVTRRDGRFWRGWFVHVTDGQGARRTRMAEAAVQALRAHGEEASVYYQLD